MVQVLKVLLLTLLSESAAAFCTWHSFRIGLACALRAGRASSWALLALLRLRSAASTPGYGIISFDAATSWLEDLFE